MAAAQQQLADLEHWVTFADDSLSDGDLYAQLGFTAQETIAPDYSYRVGASRVHKFNYRRTRFQTDPLLTYREDHSETELAELNGLSRVWDYGKTRWVN